MRIQTPPQSDNQCGWLRILPPLPPATELRGEVFVDYAVIGAGFTGLAAARRLAELSPECDIALIDAGRIGNNAAGRNSGFAIDQSHNIRAKGFAEAVENEKTQISLNRAGQDYLRELVHKHGIDCDWREEGKTHAAVGVHGMAMLAEFEQHLDMLGEECRYLDAPRMRRLTGIDYYACGLFTPGTIMIQPAALVRGLAENMPENVTVYEDSPVVEVEYGPVHRLRTPLGTVSAKTLVLANNGFGAAFGFYDKHIITLATFGSLSRELTDAEIESLGGEASWGLIPADPFGSTVRRTSGNRILIRNIYSYEPKFRVSETTQRFAADKNRRSFDNRFPMLRDVPLEFSWSGFLCLSRNCTPIFGELDKGVFASLCHNGVGISRGTICGKLIAEQVAGHDSEHLRTMLSYGRPNRIFPEPFTSWGVKMNLAARRLRAGVEL